MQHRQTGIPTYNPHARTRVTVEVYNYERLRDHPSLAPLIPVPCALRERASRLLCGGRVMENRQGGAASQAKSGRQSKGEGESEGEGLNG